MQGERKHRGSKVTDSETVDGSQGIRGWLSVGHKGGQLLGGDGREAGCMGRTGEEISW